MSRRQDMKSESWTPEKPTPISETDLERMLESGGWQQLGENRMVNVYTGEIISLLEWLMRSERR